MEPSWTGGCAIKILVIGYGNPGRLDDGIGPAFADKILAMGLEGVSVESNYQLNVEDAELVARHDVIVFADASVSAAAPFEFRPLEKMAPMVGFSSHSITAESLIGLADELFGTAPPAYTMAIRGARFDGFGECLSGYADKNIDEAVAFFLQWLDCSSKS
jgi:hydrogenase maturation protease